MRPLRSTLLLAQALLQGGSSPASPQLREELFLEAHILFLLDVSQAVCPALLLVKLVSHVMDFQDTEWLAENCGSPRDPAALELSTPFPPGTAFDSLSPWDAVWLQRWFLTEATSSDGNIKFSCALMNCLSACHCTRCLVFLKKNAVTNNETLASIPW